LTEKGAVGFVCVKASSISGALQSRGGWKYRRITASDKSMGANILISEEKYSEWNFEPGDCMICEVRSNGIEAGDKKPVLFFNDFVGPLDSARVLHDLASKFLEMKSKSSEHMQASETVYQLSAREARSLVVLIKLWVREGKPQHYTKWCQMHQIVATNLYYLGLVRRTASMSGYYYPTEEALDFFSGKVGFPKRKVFVRDSEGKHREVSDANAEKKPFQEYLGDYADRDSALKEYREALDAFHEKLKEGDFSRPDPN
jgi:hypothetical protein